MANCGKCNSSNNPVVEGPEFSGPNEIQVHRRCDDCGHVQIEYYRIELTEIDGMEDQ